jgi:nitroreductase
MNAIELLLTRQSTPILKEPMPSPTDLDTILAAGMRVPDHAGLKPWHFHVIAKAGLERLSAIYVEATEQALAVLLSKNKIADQEANEKIAKVAKMPFRAPMIIVISTQYVEHNKVPKQEQLVAAGCAAQAMQMACFALGYGAMWRTGDLAYNELVKQGLNLATENEIAGFLYIGTPKKEQSIKPAKNLQGKVTYWQ